MKRITSVLLILLTLVMLASVMTIGASASSAYQTYTYSINGDALYSPDAYTATASYDYLAMGMDSNFDDPYDIATDSDGKMYISDEKNNCVYIYDRYYKLERTVSAFTNEQGNNDALASPHRLFVNDESIWVCDYGKNRLVEFDKNGDFLRIMDAPEIQIEGEIAVFMPHSMAIDQYGRIYVVSKGHNQGVIVMDNNGDFVGFIGAQAVSLSAWDILWRRFQTEEQRAQSTQNVSTTFESISITPDGFIYVTTTNIEASDVESAIKGKSKSGKYMPVKLLNPAGDEIMRRNGFWPPAGEIDYQMSSGEEGKGGVSTLLDVAVGPEQTWTIIDDKRNKLYTYDFNGNLLFAFGDTGTMLGSISDIQAVCYQGTKLLVLDRSSKAVVVYERTEYGDLLLQAIAAENSLDYNYAIDCWEKVLQRNTNFDAAYVGIGNAHYRSGEYEKALEYFEIAYDTEGWSNSYKEVRKDAMSTWFFVIILGGIALILLVVKFFGWTSKVNKRVAVDGKARKTFGEELVYAFYIIFHPFDGFYDLKHEHRGSVRASIVIVALTILTFFYQQMGQGYVLNPTGNTTTIFSQAISVLVPLFLFVLGNWCLTTLMEGEGSFKDIFIASSYSLLPLILLNVPATIASNFVTKSESEIVTMISTVAFIWVFFLLFFGTMVTHDYSMFKNVITIVGTLVAMVCIIFIVLLFSMLLSKLVGLVSNIFTEIQYRI